jgi:hypothetical protein
VAIIDDLCRLAAADPRWALFISGVLLAALYGALWTLSEEWRRSS